MGGFILGLAGGLITYYCVDLVKGKFNIDDSLDVFAVHGVGGATGTLLVAILILPAFQGVGLSEGVSVMSQLTVQATGIIVTAVWCLVATVIIVNLTKRLVGLRVDEEDEVEGLDYKAHGETGYKL
jgi:Amt family ammonium transporter